jgi:twinkle protein
MARPVWSSSNVISTRSNSVILERISVSDFSHETLRQVLAEKAQHKVNWLERHSEKILAESADPASLQGIDLCWSKVHGKVVLQFGCLSVWVGIDGHKKTSVMTQILSFAARDHVVGMASFEMDLRALGTLMVQQATGAAAPSPELTKKFLDWSKEKILVYDHVGTVKPIEVYALIIKMARDHRAKLIVIDCLQMISGVCGDNENERAFISMLVQLAKAYECHIVIIHHSRKPDRGGDEYIPTRFDTMGSSSISQLSSVLAIVWSDKKKDRLREKMAQGGELTGDEEEYMARPDTRIIVAKNRHLPWEGTIGLWQHPSRQFLPTNNSRRMFFNEELS